MKPNELRQKSKEELETLLAEKRGHLADLRELVRRKKIKNAHAISEAKRDAARIMTILKERGSITNNQ